MSALSELLHEMIDAIYRPADHDQGGMHVKAERVDGEPPQETSPPAETAPPDQEPIQPDPTPGSGPESSPAPAPAAEAPTGFFTPAPVAFGTEGQPGTEQ
jgi:hypothetical protein